MKKEIYIAARFLTQPITGVQRYGIELSKAILRINIGYSIKFVAPPNILHQDIAKLLNVEIVGNLKSHLWDQISLLKFLKSKGNPLIVNFSNTLPIFYKNKIVTIHDIIHIKYPVSYSYKKYYEFVFPMMVKHSKYIITVSEFSRNEVAEFFKIDKNKIFVVYNGLDEKFKPVKENYKENYILAVSSIAYHKNFTKLIEAFTRLRTKNIYLYIVGGINEKVFGLEGKKLLEKIKNIDRVKFLGRVDDDTLIKLYSNALCFLYPSLYEGFGIPPLEAQACGCPVVLSDIPVFREIYGNSAIFFNPTDAQDIADKIEVVITNKSLRNSLKEKGLENAKKFTWENSAKSFFEVLKKVEQDD